MIDIHSHILCGVDDGSQSIEESVKMLHAAKEIGFDKIIATPHVMRANYDKDRLKDAFLSVSEEAKKIGIELFFSFCFNLFLLLISFLMKHSKFLQ